MSNSRAHRRRITATNVRSALPARGAAPAVIFGSGHGTGGVTPITVDRTMFLVLIPPSGASEHLLDVFSARATASTTGTCPACGGRRHITGGNHAPAIDFRHDADCPTTDENLTAAVKGEGLGWTPGAFVNLPGGQR